MRLYPKHRKVAYITVISGLSTYIVSKNVVIKHLRLSLYTFSNNDFDNKNIVVDYMLLVVSLYCIIYWEKERAVVRRTRRVASPGLQCPWRLFQATSEPP